LEKLKGRDYVEVLGVDKNNIKINLKGIRLEAVEWFRYRISIG
jgi:hypothetical protein